MIRKTYKQFKADFFKSQKAVLSVAGYFQRKGKAVYLPSIKVRPEDAHHKDYQDKGDLFVKEGKIQIKHLSREFTSLETFPFDPVIVDEQYKIKAQEDKPPIMYVSVEKHLRGALIIPWSTNTAWTSEEKTDSKQQNSKRVFTVCPKNLCFYCEF